LEAPHERKNKNPGSSGIRAGTHYNLMKRRVMQEIEQARTSSVRTRVDKPGLAARYVVGIRTVANWQASEIIQGQLEKGKWMFDAEECDKRLFMHSEPHKQGKAIRKQ
jgi:hypothetical protein